MSTDDQVVVRTRRALNSLQHSPNGKTIVGVSPHKTSNNKKVFYDSNETNSLKRRTSISLPDICSFVNSKDASNLNKSATSTPHKIKMTNKTSVTPVKFSKTNISIIIEEKENPNYYLSTTSLDKHEVVINKKETKEIAIQCNKSDEDMVFGDSVEGTNYWKLIALKRVKALLETREENSQLHEMIEKLDEKNESLRQNIKDLHDLIREYQEIKKSLIDLEDSEGNDNDSGYDA